MKFIKENYTTDGRVFIQGYLQEDKILFRGKTSRPAILVCSGGGYEYCAVREMDPIAMAFSAMGYHTFVLTYSVGEYARGFKPLEEIGWAIGCIREHAEEWKVIPNQVVVAGFSAGGHLALGGGLRASNKADAMILGYPVVDTELLWGPNAAEDRLIKSLIGTPTVTKEEVAQVDMLHFVKEDAPPMFLFNTYEDELLSREHCLRLVGRYSQLAIPCEYHLFQKGRHGLSLANDVTANGNAQAENAQVAKWLDLAHNWLQTILKEDTQ